jgi:predicted GIY-YIG superfamily endonuclease
MSLLSSAKQFGNVSVLTRRDGECVRWWVLHLKVNPGLRNDPATAELGQLFWRQYIGEDVTPRDFLAFVGLDASANVALYKETKWSVKDTDQCINVEPNGPPLPGDAPIVSHFADKAQGSRLDVYVLGELRFVGVDDVEEEEEEGEDEQKVSFIYVLECVKGKYYVGRTSNLERRLEQHKNGHGGAWTKKYPMVRLVEQFEAESGFDEDKTTLEYMETHKVDNVRGGTYCQIQLPDEQRLFIEQQMRTAQDRCSRCGSAKHFVARCPQSGGTKRGRK